MEPGSKALPGRAAAAWNAPMSLPSPLLVIGVVAMLCLLLAPLAIPMPLGPMYWDLVVYLDGAQRVLSGQTPSVDFFAPVGPLGYWLFAGGLRLFPEGQPLLLVQWSLMLVTLPPLCLVVAQVDRRSRVLAFALLAPFLVFQILPMNVEQYSTFPSVDGYGIYNRQVCQLLYVLTAALLFLRDQRALGAVIAWCCLSLFLMKVTGFLSAGLLCAFALAAGRVQLKTAIAAASAFLVALALLEALTSVPGAYLTDIVTLVRLNEDALLPRFLQAASIHFGIFGSASLLVLTLLFVWQKRGLESLRNVRAAPSAASFAAVLNRPTPWLAVTLLAGLFFETQNTGGQAFIFLWPVLLVILLEARGLSPARRLTITLLVAATALPPLVNVLHRTARAAVGQVQYDAFEHSHLKSLGTLRQREDVFRRAAVLREVYATYPEPLQMMAEAEIMPAWSLYSEIEFQVGWLQAADEAAEAILAYEERNGVRFDTIMNLNFANPFPWMLDRQGPLRIAIGADPYRAVPPPDEATLAAVAETDLVLYPLCPITAANVKLLSLYEPALAGHERIDLTPCWQAYLKPAG